MNEFRIPLGEYKKLASTFNPTEFNANAWAKLAKDSGMQYLVYVSKHHDGFAMFDSPSSPYEKRPPMENSGNDRPLPGGRSEQGW